VFQMSLVGQDQSSQDQSSNETGQVLPHQLSEWRRERDSNPRYGFPYSGFQDRPFQPLTHPSASGR
jgi:hypothetical protein